MLQVEEKFSLSILKARKFTVKVWAMECRAIFLPQAVVEDMVWYSSGKKKGEGREHHPFLL